MRRQPRRHFLHWSVLGRGNATIPKRKPYIAPPRCPRMSELPPITIIIISMKMHMPVKQHLICSSCGLPLKALQFRIIIANYPAMSPQMAVDAPIAVLLKLQAAAKILAPILVKIE